jgi:hypothetical protein
MGKITQLNEFYKHPITQKLPSLISILTYAYFHIKQLNELYKHPITQKLPSLISLLTYA